MKNGLDWDKTSELYDPLIVLKLIEKKILAHTKDQYFYATVNVQDCTWYGLNQHNLTKKHHYERFITKVDIEEAIGLTGIFKLCNVKKFLSNIS